MSNNNIRHQESGLVSIIVAITFIAIISLITTSFALLSRREARQALDRQLSTQAFYAAESGVNDAIRAVKNGALNIDNCDDVDDLNPGTSNLDDSASYTCVLINESPTSLEFSPITPDDGKTVRIQASENISSLKISWQDAEGGNTFATNSEHLLPQVGSPNNFAEHIGLLRATIIPVTGTISRDNLVNNSQTLFMYPLGVGGGQADGSYTYQTGLASQGSFVDGNCNVTKTPRHCNVVVNGLSTFNSSTFFLRLKGMYRSANVTIQAFSGNNATGNPLTLLNGQVVIDSTGKANDVLRRIQVRVPVETSFDTPDAALETADSICKKISVSPSQVFDTCDYDN